MAIQSRLKVPAPTQIRSTLDGGHGRPNQNMRFHSYFQVFWASMKTRHVEPILCLRWGEKLSLKGPNLRHVEHDLGLHVHGMASILGPSGSIWTQHQPNMTKRLHLGLKLGPEAVPVEQTVHSYHRGTFGAGEFSGKLVFCREYLQVKFAKFCNRPCRS